MKNGVKLTKPQWKVLKGVQSQGPLSVEKARSLYDTRVLNNLVDKKLIKLELGKYVSTWQPGQQITPKNRKNPDNNHHYKCLCGCGKNTLKANRRFLQGHDMKLRSRVLSYFRGEITKAELSLTSMQKIYLANIHWMTREMKEKVG